MFETGTAGSRFRDEAHSIVGSGRQRGILRGKGSARMKSGDEMSREDPQRIGPYEIREWLGEGGMGEVCRAYDTRLDREVAIKRILGEKMSSPTVHERFLREARSAARLNHPSIVQIYDLMTEGQIDWIVMEFVEGETLSRRLRRGPLDPAVALQLMRDVAEGLAEAHEQGIVHRDIKAENIMITVKGRAKILDFGLARTLADADKSLTLTGSVVGTPHAMSPEQASGSKVDARTDIFSFGSLFFHTVTGRHPFRTSKVLETMHRVRSHRQPPAHWLQPNVPEVISELIDELLEKDPDDRPASAAKLARRLAQLAKTPFSDLSAAASRSPEDPESRRAIPEIQGVETLVGDGESDTDEHSATTLVSTSVMHDAPEMPREEEDAEPTQEMPDEDRQPRDLDSRRRRSQSS